MSIVLGVLAALFGACGLAALYFGYDLGGTERGVAYTVSGTIAASAGALMIGFTVLSMRLKHLSRLLGKEPGLARGAGAGPMPAPLSGSDLPPPQNHRPGLPGEIGIAAVAAAASALVPGEAAPSRAEREEAEQEEAHAAMPAEPGAGLFAPPPLPGINFGLDDLLAPEDAKAGSHDPAFKELKRQERERQEHKGREPDDWEPDLSKPDHPEAAASEPEPAAEHDAEPARLTRGRDRLEGIFGPPAVVPEEPAAEEAPAASGPEETPSADAGDAPAEPVIEDLPPWHGGAQFTPEPPVLAESGPEFEPQTEHEAPADDAPAATPEQAGRKVIGSYTVGPNSYTMYGDGSVEALTPNGLYSFGSLEELRAFIEKGGSPAASGR